MHFQFFAISQKHSRYSNSIVHGGDSTWNTQPTVIILADRT